MLEFKMNFNVNMKFIDPLQPNQNMYYAFLTLCDYETYIVLFSKYCTDIIKTISTIFEMAAFTQLLSRSDHEKFTFLAIFRII